MVIVYFYFSIKGVSTINDHYTVYLHIFPDGKKYVGCTGKPVKARWDGGLGYSYQGRIFNAILKTGWENIRHYVLFEHLDKETAELTEAALIRAWHTYRPGAGYNRIIPSSKGVESYKVPKYSRKRIVDEYDSPVLERFLKRREKRRAGSVPRCQKVRIIETGEVFNSIIDAANSFMVNPNTLWSALNNPNRTCGSVWIEDPDEGWRMEVRAHWEYVKNNEEKDDLK